MQECEESSLPAGGWPAFSKWASFAPGLEGCCTIVGKFSDEAKRQTKVLLNRPLLYRKQGASQQEVPPKQLLWIRFLKKSPDRWSDAAEIWRNLDLGSPLLCISVWKTPQRNQKVIKTRVTCARTSVKTSKCQEYLIQNVCFKKREWIRSVPQKSDRVPL